MEVIITKFFNESDAYEFSGSQYERGENAAQQTWSNAMSEAKSTPLLTTPAELQAMRDYACETGAWSRKEIANFGDTELNALFIQFVSGDMRQIENLCSDDDGEIDWSEYERLANEGTLSGSIYRGDNGEIYYYLGI